MSPLLKFVISLVIIFLGLEYIAKTNLESFHSLSEKQLVKIEMLKNRQNNHFAFIGSSRGQDCCDTTMMSRWIKQTHNMKIKFFNASSTGYNIKSFDYMSNAVDKTRNTKKILIEISTAAYKKGKIKSLKEIKHQASSNESLGLEKRLQNSVYNLSDLVKVRKALKPKLFFRLFMIKTSDIFSHETWFRSNLFKQLLFDYFDYQSYNELPQIFPKIFKADKTMSNFSLDKTESEIFRSLENLKTDFYLINYPVKKEFAKRECTEKKHQFYQYIATKLKKTIIDYSCKELPKKFYKDDTHLNGYGRMIYSQMLARDLYSLEGSL